jgi:NAD(P)-dependent dehydrogenase (short-subunit alcohol dehydrogenase family)
MASIALVTGAYRGIGLEVARQLAQRGFTTVLGSRDAEKGRAAADVLAAEGLHVEPRRLDHVGVAKVPERMLHASLDLRVRAWP